jgi:Amt family ammonium transporter
VYLKQLVRLKILAPAAAALIIAATLIVMFGATRHASAACDPANEACPDRSGLTTGGGKNLTDLPPGAITADDFTKAQQDEPFAVKLADWVDQNRLASNFIWVLITGYLVMFMQAGFALVETGFSRAKNAAHTMAMNFMVYGLGMMGYYVAGFAFQFGGIGNVGVPNLGGLATLNKEATIHAAGVDWGIIGYKGFFLHGSTYDVGVAVMFLFQMVFMDTTATIPTGAMCERWKWSAFVAYAPFISIIIYPIYGNWVWGGGWLSQLGAKNLGAGYLDFAGSGVVHAIGGWTGLAGAMVLGPRLGKYNKDGSSNAIPGHNIVLGLLGVFILAFGWFGFNPGSTLGASGAGNLRIGLVAVNTMIASATGAIAAMAYTWQFQGKPDPSMMANGMLAGLVAITAPSGFVSPESSCVIGLIAGTLVCLAVPFFDRVMHVDDPVGAISVHGVCGMWGQISLGIFADGTMSYNGLAAKGLLFGDAGQFAAQLIGAGVAFVWAFGAAWLFFKAYDMVFGMRVPPEVELAGLDIPEMGALGYAPDAEPYRGPLTGPAPAAGGAGGAR